MSRFRRRLMGLAALRQAAADDFVRVEYIENISNAYINTGYKNAGSAWSIDATISFNQIKTCYLYGGRGTSSTRYLQYTKLVGDNFSTSVHMTTVTDTENPVVVDKKYHLNGSVKSLTIDYKDIDEETQEEVDKTFTITNGGGYVNNGQPIYIFACYGVISVANNFNGKLYGFKLYNASGTLVRDYIPMYQISTDTYGLWDRVNEEFYTSPNGVKFTGGERVIADANDNIYYFKNYISTYNTQRYLNTGIYANSTDYWETKVYLASGRNYVFGGWSANNSNMYGIHANANTISFVYGSGGINYSVNYANKIFTLKQTFDDETQTMHFYVYDSSGKLVWSNQIAKRGNAASRTFYIGNYNGSTYGSTNGTRFYYFKYYRNGELIREYIPVQSCEDGVYGFFDKVNLRFYKSNGTQPFTGA